VNYIEKIDLNFDTIPRNLKILCNDIIYIRVYLYVGKSEDIDAFIDLFVFQTIGKTLYSSWSSYIY
jgi:hypothetical protein